jgi:uncharacterized damage-inducible protein DinB
MHPSITPLAAILRLNTELLLNCLEGVTEIEAHTQPAGTGNHLAFLVAHLIDTRHFLASTLEAPLENPLAGVLAGARSMADVAELPPLPALQAAWETISAHLAVTIERLDTAALAKTSRPLPGSDGTTLGNLSFLVQHDTYHLGQVALLRRQRGHPAMSYATRPREPGRKGA